MRRWMALAAGASAALIVAGCGMEAENPAAQAPDRPLTIDGFDLALSRLELAYADVTGTYIDNASYARRLAETRAIRAVYFRLIDPDYAPITLVQFPPEDAAAADVYVSKQRQTLAIPETGQVVAPGRFISAGNRPTAPQWAIERRGNLVLIGDAATPSWEVAIAILESL